MIVFLIIVPAEYSLWAKDIIFVISDGYLDGMHAWLSAYHDSIQSSNAWFILFAVTSYNTLRSPRRPSDAVFRCDLDST